MGQRSEGAVALTWFAAFMLMLVGVFQVLAGLAGILTDNLYTVTADYVFKFNTTGWGWAHLLWGVLLVLAGFALFSGAVWARMIGVFLAFVSAVINFMFIPVYPLWAISIIVLDVFVIWALTKHGRDVTMMGDA